MFVVVRIEAALTTAFLLTTYCQEAVAALPANKGFFP
jgi:hypothetical protein